MERNFGPRKDHSKRNNGKQYKTQKGVSITIQLKKEDASMILGGGKKEYLSFAIHKIPRLFKEFKKEFKIEDGRKEKAEEEKP